MRIFLIAILFLLIFGVPVRYAYMQQAKLRNWRVVEPGMLYRSGKLSLSGLERAIRENNIKTVLTFRAEETGPQPDPEEEAFCRQLGIRYERIVYRRWSSDSVGPPPAEKSVQEFFRLMDQRQNIGPILVHCLAGKHRTGAFVALYRMEYQHWPNEDAIAEMQAGGYEGIANEDDVRGYLERYIPRAHRRP